MPRALYTQNVIAFIWDFDKTLIPGYMQDPLFQHYNVEKATFWSEVNNLAGYYSDRGLQVGKDSAYLNHILSYVRHGVFQDLTNNLLRDLGAKILLAPGIPQFMARTHQIVAEDPRYTRHEIQIEHYIVSTGLRQMIEGSAVSEAVDGIW